MFKLLEKHPSWWSPKNAEFRAGLFRDNNKGLTLRLVNKSEDNLAIERHPDKSGKWLVEYYRTSPHQPVTIFKIEMNQQELETAFDLLEAGKEKPSRDHEWADRFGLQVGVKDRFARTSLFLNLPNPLGRSSRTVSIKLTGEIKRNLEALIHYD